MTLVLYGHPFSSYTQKALIALYENATPFEFKVLGPSTPESKDMRGFFAPPIPTTSAGIWKIPFLAEAVCHHSDRYSPARLIGRAFPCAADIVGHHHTGAPTMPRPASNGIAIYQINPSSRWAVGPYPCRCRRSQQRSPQRELRPKR